MTNRLIGRRAIAALLTTSMIFGGVTATYAPSALAVEAPANSLTADGLKIGEGTPALGIVDEVAPGGMITFKVSGMKGNADTLSVKIDDGKYAPNPNIEGTGATRVEADRQITVFPRTPDQSEMTIKVRVPENITEGLHAVRFLNQGFTGVGWYKVVKASEATDKATSIKGFNQSRSGDVVANAALVNFAKDSKVTVKVNGEDAKFQAGRQTADSITIAEDPTVAGVILPATAYAGSEATFTFSDGKDTQEVKAEVPAYVKFVKGETPNYAINSTADVTVTNLPDGATVDFVGVGNTNFLTDAQRKVAATSGAATLTGVAIPNEAQLVGKNVTVTIVVNGVKKTYETTNALTPDNAVRNVEDFTVTNAQLPSGLYQSAYSAKQNALFVTRSVGRPPLKEASIYKLDPTTLAKVAEVTPADAGEKNRGLYGPYGIAVNDAKDQVWVTNTRQDTVAVYSATDLKLIKQFPIDSAHHARDIAVDTKTQKVYVTTPRGGDVLAVFDADKLEKLDDIKIGDAGVPGPMSLAFDQETGDLYTVSMDVPVAAVVHTRDNNKVELINLPENDVKTGSGVAFDPKTKQLLIASQGTNNAVVVDTKTKQVVKTINTGAQALSATFDPANRLYYVVNRTGGTATVINADTLAVAGNLAVGTYPNHVTTDGKGNAFIVNKGGDGSKDTTTNDIYRITPKKGADQGNDGSTTKPGFTDQDGSTKPGSSDKAGAGIFGGIVAVLAIVAGIAAVLGHLLRTGVIDSKLLPEPVRQAFRL
ncbi:hypothetical protein [Corynebacterium aquilae]|uniref:hypothetical protein n=1 Tax=Corynebacterium aquilae TaxID=203263 RepID=UPI000953571B|nr:hypothetical protein [Corynebacterium aquilae]